MQRTLNYIIAELEYRVTCSENEEVRKEDRIQRMAAKDAEWQTVHGGNSKWGEKRAAHLERKTGGAGAKIRDFLKR
jgi:hypothetical protein